MAYNLLRRHIRLRREYEAHPFGTLWNGSSGWWNVGDKQWETEAKWSNASAESPTMFAKCFVLT